jgi:hypothetical protein
LVKVDGKKQPCSSFRHLAATSEVIVMTATCVAFLGIFNADTVTLRKLHESCSMTSCFKLSRYWSPHKKTG